MVNFNNAFGDSLLDEVPEAAFSTALQNFGGTQNQQAFFPGQFNNIHQMFLGALGQQIQAGQYPTNTFTIFLTGNDPFVPFDFGNFFANTPRALRPGGLSETFLNPRFRFLTS